jgi:ribonuclease HIII
VLSVERWALNSYTHALTQEQVAKLRALLDELGFKFAPKEWTVFFGQKNKLSVAVYEKGPKVLVQGRGVEEFVQFELEPKVLGEAKLGYEEVHLPEMFEPHFGVDESGKGDFFGPLVISGVYVDRGIARKLLDGGVVDSKRISSDARIRALADTIRKTSQGLVEMVLIGPAKYNELYEKFANLNRLLGWGHARVIENLLPVMRELGLVTIFEDVNFGTVRKLFDENGKLLDEGFVGRANKFLDELIWMARVLRHGRENIPSN